MYDLYLGFIFVVDVVVVIVVVVSKKQINIQDALKTVARLWQFLC